MKKIVVFLIIILCLCGCKDNYKHEEKKTNIKEKDEFVLRKIDESKDFVYFKTYREVPGIVDDIYKLEMAVINVDGVEIENVNLEIKSFVTKSFNDFVITNNVFSQGNVIDYDYYITEKYVSVLQKYYFYIDGLIGEERDNVYVVSLSDGTVLDNEEILDEFGIDETQLFKMLENKISSDDIAFSIKNIKEEGYDLYINNDGKFCIVYYELTNEDSIRKELVLN